MASRDGQMVQVEDDVLGIAARLYDVDPHLRVRWSEAGNYFAVYYKPDHEPLGAGYLVLTCEELDQRVVERVRHISSDAYNYAAELDRADEAARREQDYKFSQKVGEAAERLAHALRKDLGLHKDSARSKRSWGKK